MRRYVEELWLPYHKALGERIDSHTLVDDLVARAAQHAREDGCVELALDVDLDNERALAYYEKLGFAAASQRMHLPVEEL